MIVECVRADGAGRIGAGVPLAVDDAVGDGCNIVAEAAQRARASECGSAQQVQDALAPGKGGRANLGVIKHGVAVLLLDHHQIDDEAPGDRLL